MKFLLLTMIVVTGSLANGESNAPKIRSWRTFQSDVGYEFKYPECWEVKIGDAYAEGPLHTIKDLSLEESKGCTRKRFSADSPNGIGFSGGHGPKDSKDAATKEIAFREKNAPNDIQRNEDLVFKKFKLGSNDAIAWVEVFSTGSAIRWNVKVYCPDWWISVVGPLIDRANVDNSYYEKFKMGDLALPEPEKTIIESIRCIPAKQK